MEYAVRFRDLFLTKEWLLSFLEAPDEYLFGRYPRYRRCLYILLARGCAITADTLFLLDITRRGPRYRGLFFIPVTHSGIPCVLTL